MPALTHSAQLGKSQTAVSGVEGGPLAPLGSVHTIAAVSSDKTLFYVDSAGAFAGDGELYAPAGTDVAVIQHGDAGPSEWIYVQAGAAIQRGQVLARAAGTAGYGSLVAAPVSCEPARVVGVAQHDIASGSYAWVLRKGVGEALADGSVTADSGLVVSAGTAGSVTDATAVTDGAFGLSTEDDAGATLVTAMLNCRG